VHELIFIMLIVLAVAGGAYGIHLWDQSAKESERINLLVQEIQQVRGDLYRQMKELFDAFLLNDENARDEYKVYTQSILQHFKQLQNLADGPEEQQAIADVEKNYKLFSNDAPEMFQRYQVSPNDASRKALYQDMETGIFSQYEAVSKHAENLLSLKQNQLKAQLSKAKKTSIAILSIPILLAGLLLTLSRSLLKRNIVNPIKAMMQATSEISAGNLQHKVPENGATELAVLSKEINKMADDLAASQDALVRTEKQAALGLLVPMLAHNIRNPLASIRATAQVIETLENDKDSQESIDGIIDTVDRLERWTGGLLAYLNPIKPQLNKVKLNNILDGALTSLTQKLSEKNIKLIINTENIQEDILTDQHLLEQVLYNIVLNAVDASPINSSICIKAYLSHHILNITIRDEGAGMPFTPDPHTVSPGPTTKRFGTGLGIPFAFKVCELLGGSIEFEPFHPQGTQVKLQLPQ
jgi:nitrogen fixation/metabolism regulation signal transduction histidine kinase